MGKVASGNDGPSANAAVADTQYRTVSYQVGGLSELRGRRD